MGELMALSYFTENFSKTTPYVINKYSTYKFDDEHILVTTEYGAWILLSKDEYDLLRLNRVEEDQNLFNNLEETGIIITENNIKKVVDDYRKRFGHLFNGINLHILTPTLRCNQKCIYCQANSRPANEKKYDMDEDTAKSVVDFIFQTPSKFLTIEFQGGEPLLNYEVLQFIVEYVKKKNNSYIPNKSGVYSGKKDITFQLVSNLTLMDNDIAKYLIDNKIRICTSLDGPKDLHNKNRPYSNGKGSYDDVVVWIDFFKKERKYHLFSTALPTITRFSLSYPEEIVDEFLSHGITHTRARPLNITGLAIQSWEKIGYTSEEFFEFWKKYAECILSKNRQGIFFWDEDIVFYLKRIISKEPMNHACLNKPCGIGTIQCAYNYKGEIYTCDEARADETFKLGNVKENSYREIFTSPAIASLIGLSCGVSLLCDTCPWNAYCSPCLITTYGSQKNLIPKLSSDFLSKIRGSQVKYVFEKLLFSKDKEILFGWLKRIFTHL